MKPIAIALSPNTQADDVALAKRLMTRPDLWRNEQILRETAGLLSPLVDGRLVALTSSGRSAMVSVLKAFGIGHGDEVIIQAFTCIAVPESVMATGAVPIYADIAPNTYTLDVSSVIKKITPNTKAIIVQHTFGLPAPITELLAVAKEHKLKLIEDCAHALGSTYNNKPLGTFGDVGIFSFGRDKVFSSVFGGAVVSADHNFISRIHEQQKKLSMPSAFWVAQQLFHPILFSLALPVYTKNSLGKFLIASSLKLRLISRAVTAGERHCLLPGHMRYRYSPALAYLLKNQLTKFSDYTARRMSLGQRYFSGLQSLSSALPTVPESSRVAWLRFPIRVANQKDFLRIAKEAGMYLGDWYDSPLAPSDAHMSSFGYSAGMCPVAEEAAKHVVNLPTYPTLSDKQIDTVIEFTNQHAQAYHL